MHHQVAHHRPSTPLRRGVLTLGALGLLVGGIWTGLPTSTARADSNYDGFARANGFDSVLSNPSIPTGIDIQGGGPEAEAHQTSNGIGDASAQLPYTGGTVPGLPGTAGGVLGIPVPPYPFIASSGQGGAPQTVSYPGFSLHAESTDFSTLASAVVGQDSTGATSTAKVTESRDGSLVSEAVTEASGVKLGNVLTLTGVRTQAIASADGSSGALTRTSSTSIGRISVPGLVLTLPTQTPAQVPAPPGAPNIPPLPSYPVPMGGTTLQNPDIGVQDGYFTITVPVGGNAGQKFALPAGPVLAALKSAGITMSFQAPQKLTTGIQSGTYSFHYVVPAPPQNTSYNGPTAITQTTGLATATVDLHPVPSDDGAGFTGGLAGGGSSAGATDGAAFDSGPLGPGASTDPELSVPPPTVDSPSGPTTANTPTLSIAGFKVGLGIGNLYLALVAVALCGLVASTSLRLIGVRFLWSS